MTRGPAFLIAILAFAIFFSFLFPVSTGRQPAETSPEWRAGWDAARWAIGSENSYSRNAAERVQERYLQCVGGGGAWSGRNMTCEH